MRSHLLRRYYPAVLPWLALLCLLPVLAKAQVPPESQMEADLRGPFATRQATPATDRRGELCRRLEPVARQQARFLISQLHPLHGRADALLLTDGNHGEHGIRPNAQTAYGLAVLARCVPGNDTAGPAPEVARQQALAILRFVLPTHGAGGGLCTDGKPWGGQWQSAYWAALAGRAAWLLWDDLTPGERWLAARMICDEADRFVSREPDHNVASDTKAEENAWNSQVIALAACMFPHHPRAARWAETATRWRLSAYAVPADTTSTLQVEGRPLREWVHFPNLHEDYTLENHDRVHPDYMAAITLNINQSETYDWANLPRPESVLFNADKVYANLKRLALPDGGFIYPSGQDWQLHRNPDWVYGHVAMAVMLNDPQAATLARLSLATAERMAARDPNGGVYAPGETNFPSSQSGILESYLSAWLLLARAGEGPAPEPEADLWRDLAGRYLFPYGQFGVVRTDHSVATFAWGRQVMGVVYPLRRDLLMTPHERGLIGTVQVQGVKNEAPRVKTAKVLETLPGALAITGLLERGGGVLEQRFGFLALPDGRVVYVDNVNLTGNAAAATTVTLGTLGVLNDRNWVWHDGVRRLAFSGGERVFSAAEASQGEAVRLISPWYHLDGLGLFALSSAGACYASRPTPASGRLEQLFSLNALATPNALNAPATSNALKPTVLVFYPGQTPEQTRAITEKIQLKSATPGHDELTLDDATRVTIDLNALTIEVQPARQAAQAASAEANAWTRFGPGPGPIAPHLEQFKANARDRIKFTPTGLGRGDYLKVIAGVVDFFKQYQDARGAIIDPYEHEEKQYSTPAFALAAAALAAYDGRADLLEPACRAMDWATHSLAIDQCPQHHEDFYPPMLAHALPLLEGRADSARVARWRENLRSYDPYATYSLPPGGNNWNVVSLCGEALFHQLGLRGNDRFVEDSLARQGKAFTAWGMYVDGGHPALAYDHFPRLWLADLVGSGYQGPYRQEIVDTLTRGALASLFTQTPAGELPTGGRSAHHQWNEAAQCVTFEVFAERAQAAGDQELARVYKRAAMMSLQSIKRWVRPSGELWIVKNRLDPAARHGYEGYSFHSQYNLLPMAMLSIAYEHAGATEGLKEAPTPADIGGYVLDLRDGFHKVVANAGGNYVMIETSGEPNYNPTGLIRIHNRRGNPQLGPSDGLVAARNRQGMTAAVGVAWRVAQGTWHRLAEYDIKKIHKVELSVTKETPREVAFDLRYEGDFAGVSAVIEHYRVRPGAVDLTCQVEGNADPLQLVWPVLASDGQQDTVITVKGSSLMVALNGQRQRFTAVGAKSVRLDTERYAHRNGWANVAFADYGRPGPVTLRIQP